MTLDKVFDYLSFNGSSNYLIGISGFSIYKDSKQVEKFSDLLSQFVDQIPQEGDITNVEVRTIDEAKEVVKEIYKESIKFKGSLLIRIMIYNMKMQTVSNFHLVDALCHPNLDTQAVLTIIIIEISNNV